VAVVSKKEAGAPQQPILPFPAVFETGEPFRTFFLTKLINADREAVNAEIFWNRTREAREVVLKELTKRAIRGK